MATKKKTKKKSTTAKRTAGLKVKPTKKQVEKRKTPKKSAKRATAAKKATAKTKSLKKTTSAKTVDTSNRETRKKSPRRAGLAFSRETSGPDSGGQSGDLQGLSNVETADSESVDELIEEGNAFEAGVVNGVEEAGEHRDREVHTREVPEDDVPGEYLDED
jgi:hypothetical protein